MRFDGLGLLLAITLSFPFPTHAETKSRSVSFSSFWANYYASRLSRVESQQSLLSAIPLSEKDERLVSSGSGKSKIKFVKPEIGIDGSKLVLRFPKRSVAIDFSGFDRGMLKMNRREIRLAAHKTFINYRSEALLALSESRSASLLFRAFIPEARATDPVELEVANYVGVLFANSSMTHNSLLTNASRGDETTLEEWLIQGYVKEMKVNQRLNAKERTNRFTESTVSFVCQADQLTLTLTSPEGEQSYRTTSEGWDYRVPSGGSVLTDREGIITGHSGEFGAAEYMKTSTYRPGKNLFSAYPNYAVARHFRDCCSQSGCYERVSAAVRTVNDRVIRDSRGRNSSQ